MCVVNIENNDYIREYKEYKYVLAREVMSSRMKETTIMERNLQIDLLRIIACIAVVATHGLCTAEGTYTQILYYFVGFSVPVFFSLTGFFLFNKDQIQPRYILKKCANYLRLIFLWSVLVFFMDDILLLMNGRQAGGFSHFLEILVGSYTFNNWLTHFWYLWAMVFTYLAVLLILLIFRGKIDRKTILKLWMIFLGISLILQIISYSLRRPVVLQQRYNKYKIWTYLQYVLLGGTVPQFEEIIRKKVSLKVHLLVLIGWSAFTTFYCYYICTKWFKIPYYHNMFDSLAMIVWIMLILTFFKRIKIKGTLWTSVIREVAPLTLGIYILQSIVLGFLFPIEWMEYPNGSVIRCIMAFIISLSISWLINKIPKSKYLLSV